MLNKVILIGRMAQDPVFRMTPKGVSSCTFSLAVNREWNLREDGERTVDFIDFVARESRAEFIDRYFRKGCLVMVEGCIQSRVWKDRYGQTRVSVEVVVENICAVNGKMESSGVQRECAGDSKQEDRDFWWTKY